jgi:hypothetical protein
MRQPKDSDLHETHARSAAGRLVRCLSPSCRSAAFSRRRSRERQSDPLSTSTSCRTFPMRASRACWLNTARWSRRPSSERTSARGSASAEKVGPDRLCFSCLAGFEGFSRYLWSTTFPFHSPPIRATRAAKSLYFRWILRFQFI